MRRQQTLLPLAALLAISPLLFHGPSCGHDLNFHLQSWLDAATQLRHGTLFPHWLFSTAWNAGEPRFIFYPPLSWMLGELLTFFVPVTWVATLYTWICLTLAALTMFRLARHFASPNAALLASCLYIANPYILFCAFERTAYAELLAAAWFPLLLLALLRERPTARGIAIPLALLWLTNSPAAIMGCYAMAFILGVRLLISLKRRGDRLASSSISPLHIVRAACGGMAFALGLAAFYVLPVIAERRYVQVSMVLSGSYAIGQSFLFHHGFDPGHDIVLHTASMVAVTLLAATFFALALWYVQMRHQPGKLAASTHSDPQTAEQPRLFFLLAASACGIAFLLVRPSLFFWNHLPELIFLQFPWRFLSVLGVIAALTLAIVMSRARIRLFWLVAISAALFTVSVNRSIHYFRLPCENEDLPATRLAMYQEHHGPPPTDEYTPIGADNDFLRTDDQPFWLAEDPSEDSPESTPNPNSSGDTNTDDPEVPDYAQLDPTPLQLTVNAPAPEFLIFNLRNYPNWRITRNGSQTLATTPREDGLIAVELPTGRSDVDISWHRSWDETTGDAVSILSLLILFAMMMFQRGRRPSPSSRLT